MQQTSIDAYYSVKDKIGARHEDVLNTLKFEPMTNRDLASQLGWEINRVTPRVNELVKMGILQSKGTALDVQTGRRAILWGIAEPSTQMSFA